MMRASDRIGHSGTSGSPGCSSIMSGECSRSIREELSKMAVVLPYTDGAVALAFFRFLPKHPQPPEHFLFARSSSSATRRASSCALAACTCACTSSMIRSRRSPIVSGRAGGGLAGKGVMASSAISVERRVSSRREAGREIVGGGNESLEGEGRIVRGYASTEVGGAPATFFDCFWPIFA